MLGVCFPQYLPCNTSHAAGPPPPPCAAPDIFMAFVVAAPAALLIFWLRRNLHRPLLAQLPDGVPDQIPATPEELDAPTACSSTTSPQAEAEGSGSSRASDGVGVEEAGVVGIDKDVAVGVEEDVAVGVGDEASRAEFAPTFINATVDRSAVVAGIRNKILDAFGGIHLDTRSSDESTIHPANGVLIQSMKIFCENTDTRVQAIFGTGDYTVEPYSVMLDCWVAKLEEDAEGICRREKGRRYIFLLNNTYDVWQRVRCPSAPFSNPELTNRFIPMIQRYKMCYFDECWVPLTNTRRLGKFTLVFHTICKPQMAWKVTTELRYTFRQEILDLILPSYELALLAHQANQSPLSEILYWLKRVMAGKKKQKKLTVEKLEKVIKDVFEGFTPS